MSVFFDPEGNVVDPKTAFHSHRLTPAQKASRQGLRVGAPEFAFDPSAAAQQSPQRVIVVRQAPASPQQAAPQLPASWSEALPPGVQVRRVAAPPPGVQVRQVTMQELMRQGTPGAGALALSQPQAGGGRNIVDMLIKANQQPVKQAEDASERAQREQWDALRAGGGAPRSAPPLRRAVAAERAGSPGRVWVRKGEGQPASQPRPARMEKVVMMGPGTGRMRSPKKTTMRMGAAGGGGGGDGKVQMRLDSAEGGGGRRRRR